MIQRIQSVWLLLSALSIALLSKLAIHTATTIDDIVVKLMTAERLHLMIIAIILFVLPLVAIFLFKNRTAQKKLIWLHSMLSLLLILFFWMAKDSFLQVEPAYAKSQYDFGVAVPVLSLVFNVLAYRGIRADEKLIKSADKFR